MPRSVVRPDPVWVRRKDLSDDSIIVTARFRWNIATVTIPPEMANETERTEFEYDERELTFSIPLTELDADQDPDTQITAYIKMRIGDLLAKAQKRAGVDVSVYVGKWHKKAVEVKTDQK